MDHVGLDMTIGRQWRTTKIPVFIFQQFMNHMMIVTREERQRGRGDASGSYALMGEGLRRQGVEVRV